MNKNLKTFLIVLLFSVFGFWGLNLFHGNLEEIFYWQEISLNPEMFLAQINIEPELERVQVQQEFQQELQLELESESVILVFINPKEEEKILFEKNSLIKRPVASLTKLMTALISFNKYGPEKTFVISPKAVSQEEETGNLKVGERFYLKDLLRMMLIESSNDAGWAIAEGEENFIFPNPENTESQSPEIQTENEGTTEYQNGMTLPPGETPGENYLTFVESMNLEAQRLGMKDTYFANPTGLDGFENYSTAQDLVKLTKYIVEKEPQIFEITRKRSYEVLNADGSFHHFIPENTNKLLSEVSGIIGGKTGYTDEAGGCMILVLNNEEGGYYINIILGTVTTEARFEDIKKLIDYIEKL